MKWPFFGAIGFLRKCTLKVRYILLTYVHTPKKTAKIPLEIGSRFETYFSWSSKTGPCIFLDQAKYRAKYSYLWHRETGLTPGPMKYSHRGVTSITTHAMSFVFSAKLARSFVTKHTQFFWQCSHSASPRVSTAKKNFDVFSHARFAC